MELFLKKRQPKQVLLNLSGEIISLGIADILYIAASAVMVLHITPAVR